LKIYFLVSLNQHKNEKQNSFGSLASISLIAASAGVGGELALQLFIFLPIACMWVGEAMGGIHAGFIGFSKPQIIQETPGAKLKIAGGTFLSVPIIIGLIRYFQMRSDTVGRANDYIAQQILKMPSPEA
jgi:hypothetical protein